MLRAVIIDDEAPARKLIAKLLEPHRGFCAVGQADSYPSGIELIERVRPDVAFIDVRMPGGSGVRSFGALRHKPVVVIVSAHPEHAIDAFDVEAFDFIAKPVFASRFDRTIRRLERAASAGLFGRVSPPATGSKALVQFVDHRGVHFVNPDDILFLEAEKDFTRFVMASGDRFLASRSIGKHAAQLPAPEFRRIGRSHIVNCSRIGRIEPLKQGKAVIHFRDRSLVLELGRAGAAAVKTIFSGGPNDTLGTWNR